MADSLVHYGEVCQILHTRRFYCIIKPTKQKPGYTIAHIASGLTLTRRRTLREVLPLLGVFDVLMPSSDSGEASTLFFKIHPYAREVLAPVNGW